MKKLKNKWIIIFTIIILIIIYFSILFFQNYKINKINYNYLVKLNNRQELTKELKDKHTLKRCNFNIFKPEYYQVSGGNNDALITFYKFDNMLLNNLTPDNLEEKYLGFTRVKNTTFDNLLKMVKEDCYQFQTNGKKDNTSWVYMEYNYEEEQRGKKEREEERKRIMEEIKNRKPLTKEEVEKKRRENERLQKEQEELIKELEEKMRRGEIDLE